MDGTGCQEPQWIMPSQDDHVAAQRISNLLLEEAQSEVHELSTSGKLSAQGPHERWRLYRYDVIYYPAPKTDMKCA